MKLLKSVLLVCLVACNSGDSDSNSDKAVSSEATALCRSDCIMRYQAECQSLDDPYELSYCNTQCTITVAELKQKCVDEYVDYYYCLGHVNYPLYVCSGNNPVLRLPNSCIEEFGDLISCKVSWGG